MSDPISSGVLLLAHGTVEDLDDLPEFLRRIRHGRPASPELAHELRHRYETIGGSPLLRTTERQAQMLAQRLRLPVLVGMRFWEPTIAMALRSAVTSGLRRLVVLPLAPFSVAVYTGATYIAAKELEALGMSVPQLIEVRPWGSHDALLAAHCAAITRHMGTRLESAELILTAHSVPVGASQAGDHYAAEVSAAAEGIARGVGKQAYLAYQSQGFGGGEWLGPTLETILAELARQRSRDVVVVPMGFLADHVETLFDLDVEARAQAKLLGLGFHRVPALNDDESLIEAAAKIVEGALGEREEEREDGEGGEAGGRNGLGIKDEA